jgi:hypothetical protein
MKHFDEDNFKMTVHESGFVEFIVKKGVPLNEKDVWLSRDLSMNYLPNKKFCVLTEAEGEFRPTAGARTAGASKEYAKHVEAHAMFSTNTFLKILGNLFVSINKPATKTRFFDDREKAVEWLNTFLNK